ncbi:type I CRISPR-associated protein Cas7 [Methanobrevibacter sp.]|uniref:type I CRISPR-associated protein Cas7 n=1 Tax=Methanobrevibacter sp. TaxID=66852 RepID=UPI00262DADFC|nr:type I CRISPR-associated protein Cas7 [uncultured Methanobrevibacter sp.]
MTNEIKNYYQGIYLTETIMGNPNGDFIDNSPRNFDGNVFTTDKCIKFNVRKYMHESVEKINVENKKDVEDFVFFYPRLIDDAEIGDAKYLTKDTIYNKYFKPDNENENGFENIKSKCPDVRMFGGTFTFKDVDSKQIYGPIQLSYGKDINNAQIKRLQIGAPFADGNDGKQTTTGSEAVVDDAIISYDITINPNNYPGLLKEEDLNLFKRSLWYGTNLRKSTSKKTDSKLLILIKFKNESEDKVTALNIGELKELIKIENMSERKKSDARNKKIKIDSSLLSKKLKKYKNFIEQIEIYKDSSEIEINLDWDEPNRKISCKSPEELLK